MSVLATVGLSACGAPAYTYVADSPASTYYKVPTQWHPISQHDLNAFWHSQGASSTSGIWSTAFDASTAPTISHNNLVNLPSPFVFADVIQLSPSASSDLSYNAMRDFWLPVTATARQNDAAQGFPGTNFAPLRDQTISGKQGVHGVRETYRYTFNGVTDTFDEVVLTNADQTVLYTIQVHCTDTCYTHNQGSINTVMTSFTVGSPT